jgi:hypothetical protein
LASFTGFVRRRSGQHAQPRSAQRAHDCDREREEQQRAQHIAYTLQVVAIGARIKSGCTR